MLIFLGIPLLAGYLSRRSASGRRAETGTSTFLPKIGPWALYGLLFTIVVLFALQGEQITHRPGRRPHRAAAAGLLRPHVGRRLRLGRTLGLGYQRTTTLAFTAAGNNFELAIAVAIATFGATSGTGTRRRCRTTDRGARAGRAGLRLAGFAAPNRPWHSAIPAHPRAGRSMTPKPAVLFLCTHNAGRSQMAMGFFKHLAGNQADVYSGGSQPADGVNPAVVTAMAEKGIDIAAEQPTLWTMGMLEVADVVISMGCGDSCPVLPGRRYEEWVLPDPAGQPVDAIRPIRDEIQQRVHNLLEQLGVTARRRQ